MQGWLLDWGRHNTFDNGAWFLARTIMLNLIVDTCRPRCFALRCFPLCSWMGGHIYYSKMMLCMRIQAGPTKLCTNV